MNFHEKFDVDYIVGIDEAGRGPLAGPVSVGIVVVPISIYKKVIKDFYKNGARDSKQMSEKKREEIFSKIKESAKVGDIKFLKVFSSAKMIDRNGISKCIKSSIESGLKKLDLNPEKTFIYLDGSLRAPGEFFQKTIIKGDQKFTIISLASIVAKVTRDRYMVKISKKINQYNFEIHKGYGTVLHRESIKLHGLSELHRSSYCKNCIDSKG